MIVVAAIGLLAAIAVPSWVRARERSWLSICVSNLRAMESAKAQAALELKWAGNVGPATMGNPLYKDTVALYLRDGVRPVCPSGVDCYFNAINEKASCTSNTRLQDPLFSPDDRWLVFPNQDSILGNQILARNLVSGEEHLVSAGVSGVVTGATAGMIPPFSSA